MSDAYIFRRTALYPPAALYYLGLITEEELHDLLTNEWNEWQLRLEWHVVSGMLKVPVGTATPAGQGSGHITKWTAVLIIYQVAAEIKEEIFHENI